MEFMASEGKLFRTQNSKIVETKSSGQERHLWTVIGFVCASEAPNFAIL